MSLKKYCTLLGCCFLITGASSAQSKPIPNDYPVMKLIEPTGYTQSARNLTGKNILFLYFPDCDHCQREGSAMAQHASAFKNYQVWFISTAPHEENQKFAQIYRLAIHKNFHFVRTEMQDVLTNFGSIPTPSVYIYNAEKKLTHVFKGETRIEEIIKAL